MAAEDVKKDAVPFVDAFESLESEVVVEGGFVEKYDGRPSTSSAYACRISRCRGVSDLRPSVNISAREGLSRRTSGLPVSS